MRLRRSSAGFAAARPAGRFRIGLILGLAIVALGIYAGSQVAFDYWAYWNLREEAERAAIEVAARGTPGQARQMVQAKAREYGLRFEDEDIAVTNEAGVVTVSFVWERLVELPGYTVPLTFRVNASTALRR